MRKTVSREFRDLLQRYYPGLNKCPEYWRFMRYLLFGKIDKHTGNIVIDRYHVARAEGKLSAYYSNHYNSSTFLTKFRQDVSTAAFEWKEADSKNNLAREAIVRLHPIVEKAFQDEVYKNMDSGRVYFDSGRVYTRKTQKIDRETLQQEAMQCIGSAGAGSKELLEYMNNLPVNCFTKIINDNFQAAWTKVMEIKDPTSRKVQANILQTIAEDLQPFYKTSREGKTVRVYPSNYSIPMLRREIRKVITKGWYEYDLASSQLAIVGKVWNILEVQEFLASGRKIWIELINHYGIDALQLKAENEQKYGDIKAVLKIALYSLVYGKGKQNLIKSLDEGDTDCDGLAKFGIKDGGNRFFTHPLIKAIYQARQRMIKELNSWDSVETIFGQQIQITGVKDEHGNPTEERKECIRSVLSQQAQAVELYLLLPVLHLATTTKDFAITIWQHDGFSVNFTDKTKTERWIKKIHAAVDARAKELGIITKLEGGLIQ
ncbi:hypothetical protein NIES2100_35300 [Calothrix sp. NIES-2100]|uniref:hypothetical protein n=1 Tax=Calothrix sp. NIES-2100 TaxID=1954172 RepID=UPI000B610854|nr:hypothetical protein NIES2100_35300 [Calothrix sp. NIES-2100]